MVNDKQLPEKSQVLIDQIDAARVVGLLSLPRDSLHTHTDYPEVWKCHRSRGRYWWNLMSTSARMISFKITTTDAHARSTCVGLQCMAVSHTLDRRAHTHTAPCMRLLNYMARSIHPMRNLPGNPCLPHADDLTCFVR